MVVGFQTIMVLIVSERSCGTTSFKTCLPVHSLFTKAGHKGFNEKEIRRAVFPRVRKEIIVSRSFLSSFGFLWQVLGLGHRWRRLGGINALILPFTCAEVTQGILSITDWATVALLMGVPCACNYFSYLLFHLVAYIKKDIQFVLFNCTFVLKYFFG